MGSVYLVAEELSEAQEREVLAAIRNRLSTGSAQSDWTAALLTGEIGEVC